MKYTAFYKRCMIAAALMLCAGMPLHAQAAYATLRSGDTGAAVFKLEEALAMQGFFDAMPNEVYDNATVNGVKAFQTAHQLKADGVAGNETQSLLFGTLSGDAEGDAATSSSVTMPRQLRDLSLNKQGKDVESLQVRLTELGYYTGRVSGSYGKLTKEAVTAFQRANGVTADGIAGVRTQTILYSDKAVTAGAAGTTDAASTPDTQTNPTVGSAVAYTTLKAGMKSDAVRQMQEKLKELGYYNGSVTGSFGNVTWEAVRKFQKAKGLNADGVAGQKTLEALFNTASPAPSAGTSTADTSAPAPDSSAADTSSTLKAGMKSDAVRQMQAKLKELGYYNGSVTGSFGNVTWEAVRKFQKANGLNADGVAGAKTLQALYRTGAPTDTGSSASTSTSTTDVVTVNATLQLGSRGTDVKNLQKRLKELGYLTGSADGVFGAATENAVRTFQTANALTADGVAGPKTINRVYAANAVKASTSPSASASTAKNDVNTTLKYGMKGMQQIKDMQTRLTALKFYNGSITGNFGEKTLEAVKAFQRASGLTADGIAGKNTLTKLYASGAATGSGASGGTSDSQPVVGRPDPSSVQNVNWYTYIRPYYKAGTVMKIYDFEKDLTWECVMMSNGKHSDSQPRTSKDTEIMYQAFGYKNTWTAKAVWVTMPDGKVFIASMHNVPHLSGSIKDNNFDGHLCIHFPREMKEAEETGPYAASHQKAILAGWEKTQKLIGR